MMHQLVSLPARDVPQTNALAQPVYRPPALRGGVYLLPALPHIAASDASNC